MFRGYLVQGTGTDLGKTGLSLSLTLGARELGLRVAYYKPVQCGSSVFAWGEKGGDCEWVAHYSGGGITLASTYFLKTPASPHYAAAQENVTLNPDAILEDYRRLCESHDVVIVEAAGGVLAPLNREGLWLGEILRGDNLCPLLAASPYLGTLNHTRLACEFLKREHQAPHYLYFIQTQSWLPEYWEDTRDTLERLTQVPPGGLVPYCPSLAGGKALSDTERERLLEATREIWGRLPVEQNAGSRHE